MKFYCIFIASWNKTNECVKKGADQAIKIQLRAAQIVLNTYKTI